jgi:hypothetical protein
VAQYRYAGPGPQPDGRGGIVRPGDVWEWPEVPPWGPWEPVDGGSVSDSAAPGVQSHAPDADGLGAASGDPNAGTSADTQQEV